MLSKQRGAHSRKVRNEVSVHDIELDPVAHQEKKRGSGHSRGVERNDTNARPAPVASGIFQHLAVSSQLSKVSRKDGRDDLNLTRGSVKSQLGGSTKSAGSIDLIFCVCSKNMLALFRQNHHCSKCVYSTVKAWALPARVARERVVNLIIVDVFFVFLQCE